MFLLVFGMLLEGFPAIIILVPLVLPVALHYGIDPVHLGIIFLANLQIGIFLPPVGMNIFIASARFGRPATTIMRASLPFYALLLLCVLIITYVAGVVTGSGAVTGFAGAAAGGCGKYDADDEIETRSRRRRRARCDRQRLAA